MWNRGTKRNVEPAALVDMNFKRKLRTVGDEVITKKVQAVPSILGNDSDIKRFFEDSPFSLIAELHHGYRVRIAASRRNEVFRAYS